MKTIKKTIVKIMLLVAGLSAASFANAQGTLYVSNLGQTPTGSTTVGSNSWIAQEFYFGAPDTNRYALNSIQLLLNAAVGSPSAFAVSIYSGVLNGIPQNLLGSLNGSTNPSVGGLFTYTASGITLLPGIAYFVVATAATPVSQGGYVWSAANSFTKNGSWVIVDDYYDSADGLVWNDYFRQSVFQIGIYATVVPEPSVGWLALLGTGILLYACRRV